MRKQIVVIGLGRFGISVAVKLHDMGHDVLAMDKEERNVQSVVSQLTRAIQADVTDEAVLNELGIADFDVAIVGIGTSIESSVLVTLLLKKLGVRYIVARASSELHGSILEKIGADRVVYPEHETATRIAHILTLTDVVDYIPVGENYGIAKFEAPSYLVGKTLDEIGFGPNGKKDVAVLLIQRRNEVIINPSQAEVVSLVDILIVSGADEKIERLLVEAKRSKKDNKKENKPDNEY
jgi:trk system potassium uptake protein TrkA